MTPSTGLPAEEVVDALAQTAFAVTALLTQAAAAHDLSLTQLRMLAILRDHQPRVADLAAHLGLERSSVSGLVDRAVQRGLVKREASVDDARAVRLSLTDAGRRLEAVLAPQISALLAPMTAKLSAGEGVRAAALLRKMLE